MSENNETPKKQEQSGLQTKVEYEEGGGFTFLYWIGGFFVLMLLLYWVGQR